MTAKAVHMDTISIHALELFAHHGVLPLEQELGQHFLLDLQLGLCLREAGKSDRLEDTVNYAAVIETVTQVFTGERFALLERAAQAVCDALLERYPIIETVRICLQKPDAPVPARFACVSVELLRERNG